MGVTAIISLPRGEGALHKMRGGSCTMESLDAVSIGILLGSLLVLAGILSSLVALRFGAPLLLAFLIVGMLAGEAGPGGIKFDDVQAAYTVGCVALGLILFDGGLRTRFQTFRNVIAPAGSLATVGVIVTAALTAPAAVVALGLGWTEALLMGAVVASTDAAAVFFLLHARGLRLRPRLNATLEVESGINDPLAIFLTIVLVELLLVGSKPWPEILALLAREAFLGALIGYLGGRAVVLVLNRLDLPQGLHPTFVATGALVVFAIAQAAHGSGFLAVYIAGLVVGNSSTRAHNTVVAFLDAITWLAQIGMFVVLGLLAWPSRLPSAILPALAVALALMLVARPAAVFVCLAPFRFSLQERIFISWVGLRGAVGIFIASIPLLVGLPNAHLYFDVGFVVVLLSLLVQGWTIAPAARWLGVSFPRYDPLPRRVELDLPGQLEQEMVGYPVAAKSPYLRRGLIPSWAKPTLIVRDERILTPEEGGPVREGDYLYLLAPPEKAQALDRFFVDMPPPAAPDPRLLGDFFVAGDQTLGALAEIYGLSVAEGHAATTLADHFAEELKRSARQGDIVPLGPIALLAHRVANGRVAIVGLRLAEEDAPPAGTLAARLWNFARRILSRLG
jgi:cell volume regulation protein A